MYRPQELAENLYYHELAKGLRALGYTLESNARDFEIKGVPRSVITRFSKRHRQIDEEAGKRVESGTARGNLSYPVQRQICEDLIGSERARLTFRGGSRRLLRPSGLSLPSVFQLSESSHWLCFHS